MNVLDAVRPECMAVGLAVKDKADALRAVARLAKASSVLGAVSEEEVLEGLSLRETVGTTGFGRGIAIPHCRLSSVEDFVVGVATVPDGVEFESLDGQKVRLVVFIIGPDRESNEHIRLLSVVSRVLADADAVAEMVSARSSDALREAFLRHVRDEPERTEEAGRSLFHVFVQDETLFNDLLQVFGGTEPRFTVVLEAENASIYLWRTPLFAGLWSDNPRSFSRVILSLVHKRMTNEMVRRIEQVVGPLRDSEQVLVTIQDVFYAGGSLTT
jgi:PTS system nitrogen regulatory IIA component